MAHSGYQYGTSPRKLEPDYNRKTKNKKQKKQLQVVANKPRQQIKISAEQRQRHAKMIMTVVALFLVLLAISFRNSQIDKAFNKIQEQKKELADYIVDTVLPDGINKVQIIKFIKEIA